MHRSNKKMKLEAGYGRSTNQNGSSIHSGHYMTSYLHDQNEDTVEMPIASPDATNNEVTLNTTINADQDQFPDQENEVATNAVATIATKSQTPVTNANISNRKLGTSVVPRNGQANVTTVRKFMVNGNIVPILVGPTGSISGGLTLDKTNKSLKNLMYYIKTAYSNNLTSPKWKNFKGLKLQVTEKIRLNNIIWRSWFEQYGTRDTSKRKLRLICQFANGLEEQPVSTKMSIREGKFWKARLESITNEYKKWREISRKQIKATNDGTQIDSVNIIQTFENSSSNNRVTSHPSQQLILLTNNNQTSFGQANLLNNFTNNNNNTNSVQMSSSYGGNSYFDNQQINPQIGCFQPSFSNQVIQPSTTTNYYYPNNFDNELNSYNSIQSGSQINISSNFSLNQSQQINNNTLNYPNSSFNNNTNNNLQQNYNQINNSKNVIITTSTTSSGSPTSSFSTSQSTSAVNTTYHSMPIASKQMPYNNRCRSPSPGLFQDFDLYNFSSDTLFSTYLVEDPKDTIFGTNPDLFQPDLMHLYPNFDFFDLQENNDGLINSNSSSEVDPRKSERNSPTNQIQTQIVLTDTSLNQTYTTQNSPEVKQTQTAPVQPAPPQTIPIDYSDLSNFNTLATVAAAQSINNPPPQQRVQHRQRHMSDLADNSTPQTQDNQIKMPVSLSQINSSLNSPQQYQNRPNSTSNNSNNIQNTNTIRNLLALTSSTPPVNNSNNKLNSRLTQSGSTISSPSRKQQQQQQQTSLYQQPQENQSISPLLSAVLAPNQTPNVNIQEIQINQLLTTPPVEILSKPVPNKRGRKTNAETPARSNSRQNNLTKNSSQSKLNNNNNKKDEPIPQQLVQPSQLNETSDSSANSPLESSPNNTFQVQIQMPSTSSLNFQNADSNSSEYSIAKYNRVNSTSSKATVSDLFSNTPATSSRMSRSNSVNSINTLSDANLTTAEQKRRCNIQHGFDRLQVLVPALRDGKNLKVSKAVMLQKTSEYIKELQIAREKRVADLDAYRKEIESLSDKITECQSQLPANGVSVVGNLNKTEKFEQKFNSYIKERTMKDWKFYLFSLILKPLFENFIQTVNTSSREDMEKTFHEWQQKHCNLIQLRPIVSNALRNLSRTTSIITDSAKLPEECFSAALTKI